MALSVGTVVYLTLEIRCKVESRDIYFTTLSTFPNNLSVERMIPTSLETPNVKFLFLEGRHYCIKLTLFADLQ